MNATEELRALLDERGVEWMPSVWSANDETFYKVGEIGYLATELSSGRMKVCIEGYPTPAQAIEATLGRGTCKNVSNPPGGFLCSECGWGDFAEPSHLLAGARFCPNCGREVVRDERVR